MKTKKILSLLLASLMLIGVLSISAYPVDETPAVGDTVRIGIYSNSAVEWVVTAVSGTQITLLAKSNIGTTVAFNGTSSDYAKSNLKTVVDGIATSIFNDEERAAIIGRTLTVGVYSTDSGNYCDGVKETEVANALLWPLSTREAYELDTSGNADLIFVEGDFFWLRSPGGAEDKAAVVYNGSAQTGAAGGSVNNSNTYGVRPAMYLDLTKIILKSFSSGVWCAPRLDPLSGGSADVNAAYSKNENDTGVNVVYSVDTVWGDLKYTYYDAWGGEWDPESLSYVGAAEARWEADSENGDIITITNNSNVKINAELSYTNEAEFSALTGTFHTQDGRFQNNKITLEAVVPATESSDASVDSVSVYLIISGELESTQTSSVKIGTVTLTLTDPNA